MPLVQISLAEGRSTDQVRELIRRVTTDVSESLGTPADAVRVIVSEVPLTHWGSGGQTLAEKREPTTASIP